MQKDRSIAANTTLPIAKAPVKAIILLTGLAVFIFLMALNYLPISGDWECCFRPAAYNLATGSSPYEIEGFFNAPWLLLPLVPLAFLPLAWSSALLFTFNLFVHGFIARKLGATMLATVLFVLSYPVLGGTALGQVDGLVLLGLVLPPQAGLFLLLAKPQAGIAVAIFWLAEAWRRGGIGEILRVFAPVSAAFLVAVFVYGPWFLPAPDHVLDTGWDFSLWPYAIPIGLALLLYSLRRRNFYAAIAASPFLSPYVGIPSWAAALLGLVPLPGEFVAASLATWLVRALGGFKIY